MTILNVALPVRRDNFFYKGALYADAGNNHHHTRASIQELSALLRPRQPKASGRSTRKKKDQHAPAPAPVKDQVGHWYTAQLIHYGLPVTNTKKLAKERLLAALNDNVLRVPLWIERLEAQLKKEWEADNDRVLAEARAANPPSKRKKVVVDEPDAPAPARAPPVQAGEWKGKRKRDDDAYGPESKRPVRPDLPPRSTTPPGPPPPAAKFNPQHGTLFSIPRPTQLTSTKVVLPYNGPFFFDPDPSRSQRAFTAPRAGVYRVVSPDIEDDWPWDTINEFQFSFSVAGNQWWSQFKWGSYEGVVVIFQVPNMISGLHVVTTNMSWRARKDGAGGVAKEGSGKVTWYSPTEIYGEFTGFFGRKRAFQGVFEERAPWTEVLGGFGGSHLEKIQWDWRQMNPERLDMAAHGVVNTPTAAAAAATKKGKEKMPADTQKAQPTPTSPAMRELPTLAGKYHISSPTLAQKFMLEPENIWLTMIAAPPASPLPSNSQSPQNPYANSPSHFFGTFTWGPLSGILSLQLPLPAFPGPNPDIITSRLGKSHPVTWRAQNMYTGQIVNGGDCKGQLAFAKDGAGMRIQGWLSGLEGGGAVVVSGVREGGRLGRKGGKAEEMDWRVREECRQKWEVYGAETGK